MARTARVTRPSAFSATAPSCDDSRAGISREPFEVVGLIVERDAAVAFAVAVTALVTVPRITQQQRAWRHESAAKRRAVLKAAGEHDRDGGARVALLKGTVLRAGCAGDIGHRPTLAGGDAAADGSTRFASFSAALQRLAQRHRNFCQDLPPAPIYHPHTQQWSPDEHHDRSCTRITSPERRLRRRRMARPRH